MKKKKKNSQKDVLKIPFQFIKLYNMISVSTQLQVLIIFLNLSKMIHVLTQIRCVCTVVREAMG